MKDNFILYIDQKETFDKLTNEQAGKLIKGIFEFVAEGYTQFDDSLLEFVFIPIRQSIERNLLRYHKICERNKQNGMKGGRPERNPNNPVGYLGLQNNPNNPDEPNGTLPDPDPDPKLNISCSPSVNEKEIDQKNINKKLTEDAKFVINHLIKKSGVNYRLVDTHLNFVKKLLKSGIERRQICLVITLMSKKYANTEKSFLLKPKVIFKPTNFEDYLGEFNLIKREETKNEQIE